MACQHFTRSHALKNTNLLLPECSIFQVFLPSQHAEDTMIVHPSLIVTEDQTESKQQDGGVVVSKVALIVKQLSPV